MLINLLTKIDGNDSKLQSQKDFDVLLGDEIKPSIKIDPQQKSIGGVLNKEAKGETTKEKVNGFKLILIKKTIIFFLSWGILSIIGEYFHYQIFSFLVERFFLGLYISNTDLFFQIQQILNIFLKSIPQIAKGYALALLLSGQYLKTTYKDNILISLSWSLNFILPFIGFFIFNIINYQWVAIIILALLLTLSIEKKYGDKKGITYAIIVFIYLFILMLPTIEGYHYFITYIGILLATTLISYVLKSKRSFSWESFSLSITIWLVSFVIREITGNLIINLDETFNLFFLNGVCYVPAFITTWLLFNQPIDNRLFIKKASEKDGNEKNGCITSLNINYCKAFKLSLGFTSYITTIALLIILFFINRISHLGNNQKFDISLEDSNDASETYSIILDEEKNLTPIPTDIECKLLNTKDVGGNMEIIVSDIDGENMKILTENIFDDSDPDWSKDNARIVFSSNREGNIQLYIMDSDGSNVRRITNNNYDDLYPRWSPSTDIIIYTSIRDDSADIYSINPDGSTENQLTYGYNAIYPGWSPDGKKIVFSSSIFGPNDIFVMDYDGSNISQLTFSNEAYVMPKWLNGGELIGFLSFDPDTDNLIGHVMNPDGSDIRKLDIDAFWVLLSYSESKNCEIYYEFLN